jgi:hypothetical protein
LVEAVEFLRTRGIHPDTTVNAVELEAIGQFKGSLFGRRELQGTQLRVKKSGAAVEAWSLRAGQVRLDVHGTLWHGNSIDISTHPDPSAGKKVNNYGWKSPKGYAEVSVCPLSGNCLYVEGRRTAYRTPRAHAVYWSQYDFSQIGDLVPGRREIEVDHPSDCAPVYADYPPYDAQPFATGRKDTPRFSYDTYRKVLQCEEPNIDLDNPLATSWLHSSVIDRVRG